MTYETFPMRDVQGNQGAADHEKKWLEIMQGELSDEKLQANVQSQMWA